MKYREFGRLAWNVSEIGYGMWGMAGWKESDEQESFRSLDLAVELGCNFFDTAWAYGDGLSEQFLGKLIKRHPSKKIYTATKIPPKNRMWPSKPEFDLKDVFPSDYIIEYIDKSLSNLQTERIDLIQFHVWEDHWANQEEWKITLEELKRKGKIQSVGVSVNRWEPNNCLQTLKTGFIDAVQVIYNIFDQAPEDQLFPLCRELDVAVIARVPFDEGTLTGNLRKDTVFPEGDWRGTYFVPENLIPSVEHADRLRPLIPDNWTMAELALKFILECPQVSTIIPGMRKEKNVRQNMAVSHLPDLDRKLYKELQKHRWDRTPTSWSQ